MTELRGERVLVRPVRPEDVPELRRIRARPEVVRWWGRMPDEFPEPDDPGDARFTIVVEGAVAGLVQYAEAQDPEARHADVDVFLDPVHHGRGLGTDAMSTIVRHLVGRGHHRVTLSTSPDNAPAIRCYEKVGFRPVGITRASQWLDVRGEWVDELLMDYVVLPGRLPEV